LARVTYLDRGDVEVIVQKLVERLFEDYPDPIRAFQYLGAEGRGLLESALALPRQPYYRSVHDKAAVLMRSMIKNHPFLDGNKRAAVASTIVFLIFNNRFLVSTQDELVQFALDVARSEPDMDWREISAWIKERTMVLHPLPEENVKRLLAVQPDVDLLAVRDRVALIMQGLSELMP